jgi:hypothetical protein
MKTLELTIIENSELELLKDNTIIHITFSFPPDGAKAEATSGTRSIKDLSRTDVPWLFSLRCGHRPPPWPAISSGLPPPFQ